jgi:uncharacterized protein (TIGR03086 family)
MTDDRTDAADATGAPGAAPTEAAPTVDLRPQARLVAHLAERLTDAQLSAPTPCPEMPVATLLAHFTGLATAFRDAARKDFGPTTDTPPDVAAMQLTPEWRGDLTKALDELADAWLDPSAWQGETRAGGVAMPAMVAGLVAADELVVHGWDLARATGQEYLPDDAVLQAVHGFLANAAEDPGFAGLFGPVVPVPDDAPLLDRAIGLAGRDPHWTPPGA